MRITSYEDSDGRMFLVQLPDGVPDSDASMGLPLGPPDLSVLNLPLETEVRLNNQLFHRRILTAKDARIRRQDIFAAWQAALRVDTDAVVQCYNAGEIETEPIANGSKPSLVSTSNRRVRHGR